MKGRLMLATLIMAALLTACEKEDADEIQTAVICEATLLDASGATVATMSDTVPITIKGDSVTMDPRPCRVVSQVNGYLILNETDSVTGNPNP